VNLREELHRVIDATGSLTPENLVEYARPKDSPLHDRIFHCSVKEAAELHWLQRARELIKSVKVVEADGADRFGGVRAFHAIRDQEDSPHCVFEPIEDVVADPLKTEILRRQMERDWKALKSRYAAFQDYFRSMVLDDLGEAS
jgi:hypothetical protein